MLRRTRNEVVKKAEFVVPPFQPTSSTTNVSTSPQYLYVLLVYELGKKIEDSQKFTRETLLILTDRVDKLDKGKGVSHAYSNKGPNPNPSIAPASTTVVEYDMPLKYFVGQTPPSGVVRPSIYH